MIEAKCDCCGNSLSSMGAVLLSPSQGNGSVQKFHICTGCWPVISKLVKRAPMIPEYVRAGETNLLEEQPRLNGHI